MSTVREWLSGIALEQYTELFERDRLTWPRCHISPTPSFATWDSPLVHGSSCSPLFVTCSGTRPK